MLPHASILCPEWCDGQHADGWDVLLKTDVPTGSITHEKAFGMWGVEQCHTQELDGTLKLGTPRIGHDSDAGRFTLDEAPSTAADLTLATDMLTGVLFGAGVGMTTAAVESTSVDGTAEHPAWCAGHGQTRTDVHDQFAPHRTPYTTLDLLEISRTVFTMRVQAYTAPHPAGAVEDEQLEVDFDAWDHETGEVFHTGFSALISTGWRCSSAGCRTNCAPPSSLTGCGGSGERPDRRPRPGDRAVRPQLGSCPGTYRARLPELVHRPQRARATTSRTTRRSLSFTASAIGTSQEATCWSRLTGKTIRTAHPPARRNQISVAVESRHGDSAEVELARSQLT